LGFDPVVQQEEMATFGNAVATRKAGWGVVGVRAAPGSAGGPGVGV